MPGVCLGERRGRGGEGAGRGGGGAGRGEGGVGGGDVDVSELIGALYYSTILIILYFLFHYS